ncbi:hypothetical protein ARMGADRAFT_1082337 [Armillaria gallica]|uniref:Uncharacterized protein n=1 Tax=Armillaria gallica TaxID=47427 RepID=A0A2H3D7C8_ARMGA|nr:hypothetical protein ARMGADRAFT_1082337 [Armillaria gallica]
MLGYLIIHSPTRTALIKAMHSFKKFKGRTPASSDPPSRNEPKTDLKEASKTHIHKEAKDLCPATTTRTHSPRFRLPSTRFRKQAWCTHIAPESTYLNEDSSSEEFASVLAVLKSFDHVLEQLNDINIHFLPSIITTQSDAHECFTRLDIWTTTPSNSPLPEITSTTPGNENPPPFHPRSARYDRPVFWGIDKQDRVVEDLDILAEDESSAEVLSGALLSNICEKY